MSLDNLHRRIDALLEQLHQALPNAPRYCSLKYHLFTPAEQERIHTLLSLIDYSLDNLKTLTDEQLDQLHTWLLLEPALDQEDTAAIAHYRRRLAVSVEQLLAAFLAIDENSIPDFDQAPQYIDEHNVSYTLYRTMFRSMRWSIEHHRAQGGLLPGDLDTVRMWVETFAA